MKSRDIVLCLALLIAARLCAATPEQIRKWMEELGADDFRTRQAAEKALLEAGGTVRSRLEPLRDARDPEVRMRARRILRNLPPDLESFFAEKRSCRGEAREGKTIWPCVLIVKTYNPDDGAFTGTIEWTTLNALHKIEGTLSDEALVFTETEFIRKGNAVLDVRYTFPLDEALPGKLAGRWENQESSRNGKAELLLGPKSAEKEEDPKAVPGRDPFADPFGFGFR